MKNLFDNFDDDGLFDSDPSDDLTGNFDDMLQSSVHHGDSLSDGGGLGDSDIHGNFHDSGVQDLSHSDWHDSHSGLYDTNNDSGMPDMNHSDWHDTSPLSQSDNADSGFQHDDRHDLFGFDQNHSDWHDASPLSQFDNVDSGFQHDGNDSFSSEPHHLDWSEPDTSFPSEHQPDSDHSGTEFQSDGHDSAHPDPHHPGWSEPDTSFPSEHQSDSDHSGTEFQSDGHDSAHPDWIDSSPDFGTPGHQPEFHSNQTDDSASHQTFHDSHQNVQTRSVRFASSTDSNHHHITMSDSGYVYLDGDREVGHIDGHTVYNKSYDNCGYWTTDGKVYDYHDHLVGWVHPDGHVYAKGKDGDLEVYETTKGVAGGAAYLLLVWCGGQTHA